jgi:hypothetical protein
MTPTQRWFTLALLLLLFARLTLDARALSFTSDEPSHIASGYAYLDQGATWTIPKRGHPLLLDAWLALPFYLAFPDIPLAALPGWQEDNTRFVQAFVPYVEAHLTNAEAATRLPAMLLTVVLAAVVWRWSADLSGTAGGLTALLILVLDPTLLAHGMLATNDAGVTALGTAALFLTHRLIRRPNAQRLVATGGLLSVTLLAKGSGVIWLAGSLGMVGLAALRDTAAPREARPRWWALLRWGAYGLGVATVALLGVWSAYGFEVGPLPRLGLSLPVPAPTHWQGIFAQSHGADERWTYFLGEVRRGGHWAYFPVAMVLKNPLPLLLLALWGGAHRLRCGIRAGFAAPELALFPLLYGGVAVWTGVNIGYRHMLPVHPFLYLLIGALPRKPQGAARHAGFARLKAAGFARLRAAGFIRWALIAALSVVSFAAAPRYLSFFNRLAGGPALGWRYLADSNTDWGQGKKYLHAYEAETDQPLRFSGPEGYVGLQAYGISYTPLPPVPRNPEAMMKPWIHPAPGRYVISHNSLSGLGMIAPDNYAWFRYQAPARVLADVLSVYEVPPLPETTWLAQCTVPAPPLDAPIVAEGFPAPPTRRLDFDCTQSWIYPGAESGPGWYALHAALLQSERDLWQRLHVREPQPRARFTARHTAPLALTYRQWDYRNAPAFLVYRRPGEPPPRPKNGLDVVIADAATPPAAMSESVAAPVALRGPLAYLGTRAYPTGEGLEIETWWRVEAESLTRPFSLMAHLIDAQGNNLGVGDGLGAALTSLHRGDVLVQAHTFPDTPAMEGLWLRTGAYWLDSGERWRTGTAGAGDAIFVPLAEAIP